MSIKRKRLSQKERQQVWQKCNGHCAYCGCKLPYNKMHVDHVRSINHAQWEKIRTGKIDEDINEMDNLLPACGSCNRYKHCQGLEEFRDWMTTIVSRLRHNNVTYQIAERYGLVQEIKWDGKFYFERIKV